MLRSIAVGSHESLRSSCRWQTDHLYMQNPSQKDARIPCFFGGFLVKSLAQKARSRALDSGACTSQGVICADDGVAGVKGRQGAVDLGGVVCNDLVCWGAAPGGLGG